MKQAGGREGITLRGVTFSYPGTGAPALEDLTLHLEEGAIHCVLGGNGSGKSTLIKCMNALVRPSSGRVVSCGLDTAAAGNAARVKRLVATVFQDPDTQLVGSTVEEDVAFGPENLGLEPGEIRERVDEALRLTGIPELARRQVGRLSQGEKQLVAIAGGLAMRPRFLLSDESTSMLDYRSRTRVLDLFRSLKERGTGVVHVTHFLEEAIPSDRVVILDDGRLAGFGTPRRTLGDPGALLRSGLEPLPATLVAGELLRRGRGSPGPVLEPGELL